MSLLNGKVWRDDHGFTEADYAAAGFTPCRPAELDDPVMREFFTGTDAEWEAHCAKVREERENAQGIVRPRFKTARQLVKDCPHLRPAVVHGLIRTGETMNLIAPSKARKSWLILDLALSIASGRMFLGQFVVEPGPVLIIDNELHSETIASRLPKVGEAMGLRPDEWMDNVTVDSLRGRCTDIFKMAGYFARIEPGQFKTIILDAYYRFSPAEGDENSNGQATLIYNAIDGYAARLGCCFVLIHHTSKGNQSEKNLTDVGSGAGVQSRAADAHVVLREHEEENVVVLDGVVRSWPPVTPLCLRWNFPIWTQAPELDPATLKRAGSRRKRDTDGAEKPKEEPWTLERFIGAFVTSEAQDKKVIVSAARVAGMTHRMIDAFIADGEKSFSIFRWPDKNRRVMLANRSHLALAGDGENEDEPVMNAISHTHTPPHTPHVDVNVPWGGVSVGVSESTEDFYDGIPI